MLRGCRGNLPGMFSLSKPITNPNLYPAPLPPIDPVFITILRFLCHPPITSPPKTLHQCSLEGVINITIPMDISPILKQPLWGGESWSSEFLSPPFPWFFFSKVTTGLATFHGLAVPPFLFLFTSPTELPPCLDNLHGEADPL